MKKAIFIITVLIILVLSKIINAQPTISSFTPLTGPIGTTVTVTGTNFNSTPANNIVFFGATKAIVNTANSTDRKSVV